MKKTKKDKMQDEMNFLDKKIKNDPELKKLCQQEGLILDVTELIAKLMEENRLNNTKLAKLLNKNRDYIAHILDGSANPTLRQVANIFTALGSELVVTCKELK
jgi:DNA-binding phage protein